MRIISGKYKGKKIFQPTDKATRPLKDLTKESIFNIIQHSNLIRIKIEKTIKKIIPKVKTTYKTFCDR